MVRVYSITGQRRKLMKQLLILAVLLIPLNLNATQIGSGSAEIFGTFTFDFESGTVGNVGTRDIFWEQLTDTTRQINVDLISGNQGLIALGVVNFAAISENDLLGFAYGTSSLIGPPDPNSLLGVNSVFAVNTQEGNYAKVLITAYSQGGSSGNIARDFYDMHIQYEVFDGVINVAEPTTLALLTLGLLGLGFNKRKRH